MTSHSCSNNACTVSMRTAHRRAARRRDRLVTALMVACFVYAAVALLGVMFLVGLGIGGGS